MTISTQVRDRREDVKHNAWAAWVDAQEKNEENCLLWSEAKQKEALEILNQARDAYMRSQVYLNYRKKYITVKIADPVAADKITPEARAFRDLVTQREYQVEETYRKILIRID